MDDQRRSPRFEVRKMVRLDFGREALIAASTVNYSEHGLLCQTRTDVPVGSKLAVLLQMDEEGVKIDLPVEAVVARLTGFDDGSYELGLDLLETASDSHTKLMSFFAGA